MIEENNFYVCNRCGQKIVYDWKEPYHIHPSVCHTEQIIVETVKPEVPVGIAACI